jgi:hypothetical protein
MTGRKRPLYAENDLALARALGVLSIGLGLVDVFARRAVSEKSGVRNEALVGLCGLREIATGIGLLAARDPVIWVWARVGGDALDMGTLASGITPRNPRRNGALAGLLMVAAVTVLDLALAGRLHCVAERGADPAS